MDERGRQQPPLEGRTAIVTGASRGIGLASARALAQAGASVVLTARDQQAADAAAVDIAGTAAGFGAHAADQDAAARCIDFTIDRFGGLDILVNNAGTNPAYGPMCEQRYPAFSKTIEINVWAPTLWTALAATSWFAEHGGVVVNIASIGGLTVEHDLGVYNASKAALIQTTRQLALELGPKVRVNAVAPGVVRTRLSEMLWRDQERSLQERLPLGRIGEPDDIGAAVAFLASDAAAWITGHTLVVDGGALLGDATAVGQSGGITVA